MRLCINCTHHWNVGRNPKAPGVWYNHECHHPSKARIPTVDPVTGAREFLAENDLGRTYGTDQEFPNCRDVNRDGECPLYEESIEIAVNRVLGGEPC